MRHPAEEPAARWDESGPETVVEGVHRIPLPLPQDGLRAVNVYLVEDADGLTMIDAGWALDESMRLLESGVASLGHSMSDVHDVLVTHSHRDHYTQAMWMRRDHGSRVNLGEGERAGLDELLRIAVNAPVVAIAETRRAGAAELADDLESSVWPAYDQSSWGMPDRWIQDGDRVGSLTAVATPGHTRGHIVWHDEDAGLIFSGDHVLPHITPSIGFELGPGHLPLKHYLSSLRLMLERPDGRLLASHGPVTDSCHARVVELLEHHRSRFQDMNDLLAEPMTAATMASLLPWTRRGRRFDELDPFNQMLAICETAAHLDVMVDDASADAVDDRGVVIYTRIGAGRTPRVVDARPTAGVES